ncbi:MAG: HYR domain-containing protein [Flavobacteriaceae bacterium]|nr:HYR domain-containing protein [Flavobacteriaceae bacterium]
MRKPAILLALAFLFGYAPQMTSQNISELINSRINHLEEDNSVRTSDNNWIITSEHTSRTSGVRHIYYTQTLNGVEIYGSQSSIHLLPNGEVLRSNMQFVQGADQRATSGINPVLSAQEAVQRAASHFQYAINGDLNFISRAQGPAQQAVLSPAGISMSNIPVKLVYQIDANDQLVLAWDLSIEEMAQQNWWSVRVNAITGEIIDQVNWMSNCNFDHDHSTHEINLDHNKNLYNIPNYGQAKAKSAGRFATSSMVDSYEVFAMPIESPYFGTRTIEVTPANATASPFGWHDTDGSAGAEFTTTQGNNTNTYEDGDNPGYQANGGPALEFTGFPFSQTYSNSTQYEDAALTNLFYWTNIIHDVLYQYGFDEASGNFQFNNYGNGGAGSDEVNAEAQDGSGTCNANFGTPADGSNPRMQMYVCNDKDGDFDNLVIVHEYGHGISNRLTGGPGATGCLSNSEQMGEGWSDWYGLILTMDPGDTATDSRTVGTYLFGQGPGGGGIRPTPYNTDFGVNGSTYNTIITAAVPHGVGYVWSTMLWEMTWELIDNHGWDADIYNFTGDVNQDAGNVQAMALVTEALKLQPCSPGFVDGRDAIIAADAAIYGGANECAIWDAFARRGLGFSANQGSSGSRSDGTEAFDLPTFNADLPNFDEVCESDSAQTLGGGTPFGGVYSGPGVTDDGNGTTFTFDPMVAGVGVHTITYDVPAGACYGASSDTNTVEVVSGLASPTTTGVPDFCVGDSVTVTATPADPANEITWFDQQTGGTPLATGTSYTFTPPGTTSVYAEEAPPLPASQLKISEITLQADKLEIQNVGDAFDYTGYSVALSDTPYSNINSVNSVVQGLGAMGADSARFWDEVGGSGQDWGVNIFWNDGQPGWIIIIDGSGNVVDSVFWNTPASEIATLNVNINGFNITAADLDWNGNGASFGSVCDDSYRRSDDSDDASNWANGCLTSDYGTPNSDISLTYQGCVGMRTEAEVTADSAPPTIDCPSNITVDTDAGSCEATGVNLGTPTTSDNCSGETTSNDAPAQFPIGTTTVTWTATDAAGNIATCTQDVTVVDAEAPSVDCPADVEVDVNEGELYTLPDYTGDVISSDNCTTSPVLTQDPVAGTEVGPGVTTITIISTDDAGNAADCTFTVTVTELLGVDDNLFGNEIVLFPNPTDGRLTLINSGSEEIQTITITDVNGRTIQTLKPQNTTSRIDFSIEALAQGMYFVRIDAEASNTIKRIVKK